MSDHNHYDALA
jgi:hypothetical protein